MLVVVYFPCVLIRSVSRSGVLRMNLCRLKSIVLEVVGLRIFWKYWRLICCQYWLEIFGGCTVILRSSALHVVEFGYSSKYGLASRLRVARLRRVSILIGQFCVQAWWSPLHSAHFVVSLRHSEVEWCSLHLAHTW